MRRIRRRRRSAAALALLPVAILATTTSITIAAQTSAPSARISASDRIVPFGERFRLAGSVPGASGMKIQIKFRARGARQWRLIDTVRADARGTYRDHERARRTGLYMAVPAHAAASAPEPVKVRSRAAFHVGSHALILGHGMRLDGVARPGGRRPLKVIARGPDGGVQREFTSRHGQFGLRWRPNRTGNYRLRAYPGRNSRALGGISPARRVTVYRYALASWYGPGLYGNATACGRTLEPGMLGVANKSLPCGTKVRLRYHGRSVTVPVIDRGPYAGGREYDLTAATKHRLGFPDVGTLLTNR
jgi:rare lipoprotein A